MAKGILGIKVGMTQIFDENGNLIPVTVVSCEPNVVVQQKTMEKDGYNATQLGLIDKKEKLVIKPEKGHFEKAKAQPKRFVREIRFPNGAINDLVNFEIGQEVPATIFEAGDMIDAIGTSKGKGFQGTIKRFNAQRGPSAHGSGYHRGIGSMGAIKGKLKGKKMPGQMGNERVTIQNLKVVLVDADKNVILVRGSIPGPKKSLVMLKSAVKSL
jgi:large subunit ribosomal protein L3